MVSSCVPGEMSARVTVCDGAPDACFHALQYQHDEARDDARECEPRRPRGH